MYDTKTYRAIIVLNNALALVYTVIWRGIVDQDALKLVAGLVDNGLEAPFDVSGNLEDRNNDRYAYC